MVVGGCGEIPLGDARKMVADGVAALVPYAKKLGVRIGLEPLHPMYVAERSVLVTIGQALEMASKYDPREVGVILDTFHIWWDPRVEKLIGQAAGRIYGFHVSDWLVPLPDVLMGRGLMGDGVIDNRKLRAKVEEAGYNGRLVIDSPRSPAWRTPSGSSGTLSTHWFEEDEEVFVHPRNPYTRVDALRSTRPVRIEFEGVLLAESSSPVMVFETGLPTRYYLNRTEVRFDHFVPCPTVTRCPYKGTTTDYWSAVVGGTVHADLAWSYGFPTRQLLPIAGLVAFFNERVDLFVDGERQERPVTHFAGR